MPGRHAQAGENHVLRPVGRLGVFLLLVTAATFAIIGLDWGGVLIALLIVAGAVITAVRGAR
ncbi:MAG TPA: hypothetical protein VGD53_10360 [Actinoallomurus sp.]